MIPPISRKPRLEKDGTRSGVSTEIRSICRSRWIALLDMASFSVFARRACSARWRVPALATVGQFERYPMAPGELHDGRFGYLEERHTKRQGPARIRVEKSLHIADKRRGRVVIRSCRVNAKRDDHWPVRDDRAGHQYQQSVSPKKLPTLAWQTETKTHSLDWGLVMRGYSLGCLPLAVTRRLPVVDEDRLASISFGAVRGKDCG